MPERTVLFSDATGNNEFVRPHYVGQSAERDAHDQGQQAHRDEQFDERVAGAGEKSGASIGAHGIGPHYEYDEM